MTANPVAVGRKVGVICARALTIVVLALTAFFSLPADAALSLDKSVSAPTLTVPIADGCGPNRYRGPGGACHLYGRGPFPNGYRGPYGSNPAVNQGCGAGRYRGPYGSCHKFGTGPYPGGYYGPYYR